MSDFAYEFVGLFETLGQRLAPDPGWPERDWPVVGGFSPENFEIVVGAVLIQNTRWDNVQKCLERLRVARLTTPPSITESNVQDLEKAIRASGFFRRKARTLIDLSSVLNSDQESALRTPNRLDLLQVKGIGPETADCILLYAFRETHFVADSYTRRFLSRLGLVEDGSRYEEVRSLIEAEVPKDPFLYGKFHALIVQFCKEVCRSNPACHSCFLRDGCPSSSAGIAQASPRRLQDAKN